MVDSNIENKAGAFLNKYRTNSKTNYTNVIEIAEKIGFKVLKADMEDEGRILISKTIQDKYGSDKVIIVNRNNSATRMRFTVAHELGHYELHVPPEVKEGKEKYFAFRDVKEDGYYTKPEREANAFASALLMPAKLVEEEYKELYKCFGEDDIVEMIAQTFLVSLKTARFRLINLGLLQYE